MNKQELTFVIVKRWWKRKKYHIQIFSSNGRMLMYSPGYYNQKDAIDTAETIIKHAGAASLEIENNYI